MREITRTGEGAPGAVPGTSTQLDTENHSGIGNTTEQGSVDIAKGLEGEGGATVGEGAGKAPEKAPRKPPKAGLCKRRGCRNPVANGAERLCAHHIAITTLSEGAAGASPSGNRAMDGTSIPREAGALPVSEGAYSDTEPHTLPDGGACAEGAQREAQGGGEVVRFIELRAMGGGWRGEPVEVVTVGSETFGTVAGGVYMWAGEGKSWRRWAGRGSCRDCGIRLLDSDPLGERCFTCNERSRLVVRKCVDCEAVLGKEVAGPRCSVCAEAEARKCAAKGCREVASGGGIFCSAHELEAASRGAALTCDNLPAIREDDEMPEEAEQPNDGRPASLTGGSTGKRPEWSAHFERAYLEFAESLWDLLADDPSLDRATVEACKALRNDERLFLQIFAAGVR
jgi:hypothetical protein